MDLPVYKCFIDANLESALQVEYVSLVGKPAIEKNFMAFNEARLKFAVDNERRIISGPAMLADMLIYRTDPVLGEFYTVFDKETILSIVQKFFKKGYNSNFNIMHDPEQKTPGVTIFESFITDKDRGILPMKGYEDVADGSWFLSAYVDDDAAWQMAKTGELRGFSVEGLFKQLPIKQTAVQQLAAIEERVAGNKLLQIEAATKITDPDKAMQEIERILGMAGNS